MVLTVSATWDIASKLGRLARYFATSIVDLESKDGQEFPNHRTNLTYNTRTHDHGHFFGMGGGGFVWVKTMSNCLQRLSVDATRRLRVKVGVVSER